LATLLESVCRNLFILFYFSKYGEFGSFIFFPKILLYVLKLYFFEKNTKKKREKNAGPHPILHSIPFHSFLSWKKKTKKKEEDENC